MRSNKKRLYVALYARGGSPTMPKLEDTYHWALLVGPKSDSGKGARFHAREAMVPPGRVEWRFEEQEVTLSATSRLLVRVTIAKIENRDRVNDILRGVPVRQGTSGWNCVGWVKEALELLKADEKALGTNVIEWEKVREAAMSFCQQKEAGRFNTEGKFDLAKTATYDLIEDKEVIP